MSMSFSQHELKPLTELSATLERSMDNLLCFSSNWNHLAVIDKLTCFNNINKGKFSLSNLTPIIWKSNGPNGCFLGKYTASNHADKLSFPAFCF